MIEPWYDMKTSMSREIGETMIHWANNFHGYPGEYTADEWSSLLYMHGCTLRRYGGFDFEPYAEFDYFAKHQPGIGLWRYIDETDVSELEAKASMQWLVDHFTTLWD